jgi:hypothetical protein
MLPTVRVRMRAPERCGLESTHQAVLLQPPEAEPKTVALVVDPTSSMQTRVPLFSVDLGGISRPN